MTNTSIRPRVEFKLVKEFSNPDGYYHYSILSAPGVIKIQRGRDGSNSGYVILPEDSIVNLIDALVSIKKV